jgi:L-histidine Nalpha-methyltransferase
VSPSALARCARELAPFATVAPIEDSYLNGLRRAVCGRRPNQRVLVLFVGSTIGNFDRTEAEPFLGELRGCLMPGDALLLGADLIKPPARMILAYDDPTGVTAAFNRNLLARINRELDADFDLRNFVHEASWNPRWSRIEIHLRAKAAQTVAIRGANFSCQFRKGETIWTESCHKFRAAELSEMAARADFECVRQWIDAEWPFAESLLIV